MASELETLSAIESSGNLNPVQKTRLAQLRASGDAGNPTGVESTGSFNNPSLSGGGNYGQTDLSGLFKQQQQQENQLIQNIQNKISGQETLPNAYTRLSTAAGIPGLEGQLGTFQQQISDTQTLLDKLEGNINERTSGTMTTEAQRERLLAAEKYPLDTQLGLLGQGEAPVTEALTTADQNVTQQLQLEQQQQQTELQPDMLALSTFQDQAARETTGYTQDNQNKLQLYMQQIANNQALTLQQQQEAANLAQMEKQYQLQAQQFKSLGRYGGVVFNPLTGQYQSVGIGSTTTTPGTTGTNPDQTTSGGGIQALW